MSNLATFSFLFILSVISPSYSSTDLTLTDRASNHDVVCAVIKKISDSGIFPDDNGILRRIAWVESKFGQQDTTYRDGYYGGIWQISQATFTEMTKNSDRYANLNNVIKRINEKFGIDIKKREYPDLLKPFYSGLFARMLLHTKSTPIPEFYDLDGQAKYWKTQYSDQGKGNVTKFKEDVGGMEKEFGEFCDNCQGRMNLAIVLDGSGSIKVNNFEKAKTAVINLIDTFSNNSFDVGFVVFSLTSKIVFSLNSNMTRQQMKDMIRNANYPESMTNTNLGIEDGVKILNNATDKEGVPKVMAVFTDGEPTCEEYDLKASLNKASKSNITMFAIGIGSQIHQDVLLKIAGSSSRVMMVSSYEALSNLFKQINSQTCRVPQKPDLGKKVKKDQLSKHEKRYFRFHIPGTGITVKIEISKGKTHGYFSYSDQNPSSAMNDGEFTNEVFIPAPKKYLGFNGDVAAYGDNGNETVGSVYVTIEGQEDKNEYSLNSLEGNQTDDCGQLVMSSVTILFCMYLSVNFMKMNY